ncbi:signal peptidase I [Desulfotomaculum arcticum]|uniref:Signal peptidase I n=1 Tax=Desulfotruncus arcticus DSM 17038 TaxID=1121424 RepID=A0A1I2RHP4_9FIRM|nr:signal peptidase I [Desulfotruncus arcticus]SFG40184.1 signal peptidase I [Desulfotomaculum arcticum] [Desulfotruncus arcticus DSM 17038]
MDQPGYEQPREKKKKSAFMEIIESIAIAVLLAVIIRMFVFQPFVIPSGSMEPTIQIGDRIMVSKFAYHFGEPSRGDIVVFRPPFDPERIFVKRLIGTPGNTLEIRDSKLFINGEQIPEEYLPQDLRFDDFGPAQVPADNYFMMGDNRNNSDDSRVWGNLPQKNIIGKAVMIYWPINHIRLF